MAVERRGRPRDSPVCGREAGGSEADGLRSHLVSVSSEQMLGTVTLMGSGRSHPAARDGPETAVAGGKGSSKPRAGSQARRQRGCPGVPGACPRRRTGPCATRARGTPAPGRGFAAPSKRRTAEPHAARETPSEKCVAFPTPGAQARTRRDRGHCRHRRADRSQPGPGGGTRRIITGEGDTRT